MRLPLQRFRHHLTTASALCAVALALSPVSASAGGLMHIGYTVSGYRDLCGLTTFETGRGLDNVATTFDSGGNPVGFTDAYEFGVQFAANGKAIHLDASGTQVGVLVVNPDGSLVATVTVKGMPEKWSLPGGATITLDAGVVVFQEVTTTAGDVTDSIPRLVGPHPEVESNFGLVCPIVIAALT